MSHFALRAGGLLRPRRFAPRHATTIPDNPVDRVDQRRVASADDLAFLGLCVEAGPGSRLAGLDQFALIRGDDREPSRVDQPWPIGLW